MKIYFTCLTFCLLVFAGPGLCFNRGLQRITREGALKNCLIVSDIHFSPLYGSSANDTALKRKLERWTLEEWKKYFKNSVAQMTLDKSLLYQDANYAVLQSALVNMKKKLPHPVFIIIAGDFIWHNATIGDSTLKKKTIKFIARLFKESFPGATIIPTMGNNDTYGNDYDIPGPRFLKDFTAAWGANLPKSSGNSLKAQGYYTYNTGKLKLIVINSALLSYGSHYPQAESMFAWLQKNLAGARGKNVWIITHIPPGLNGYNASDFWNDSFTQEFVNMVIKYAPTVKFMIGSHTHFNDFKVFYNASKIAAPVAFMRIVPSICADHGNNPSFEIAGFNRSTGKVIHETNYSLNLTAVNQNKHAGHAIWSKTLILPASLKLNEIDASNFSRLIDRIKNDKTGQMLNSYINFYNVGTAIDSSSTINHHNYLNYLKADSLKGN